MIENKDLNNHIYLFCDKVQELIIDMNLRNITSKNASNKMATDFSLSKIYIINTNY